MKAIKIASGFAVTALAAAIAGQAAAADTETEFSYAGSMKVASIFDFENETRVNAYDDAGILDDDDFFGLDMVVTVTNGPFEGGLKVQNIDGVGSVGVEDITVTEGPISFGEVGSVVETTDLMETVTDDNHADLEWGVDAAFRYTNEEAGIKVQAEGDGGPNAFGVGANYTGDFDTAKVYLDAQYSEDGTGEAHDEPVGGALVGAGAEITPTDELKVTVAFQQGGFFSNAGAAEAFAQYGIKAEYTMDNMSAYALYGEPHADTDDNEIIKVGGSFTSGAVTTEGSYTLTTAESAGDELNAKVTYTQDAVSAYAEVTLSDMDADDADPMLLELGASYTTESGIKYGFDFENQGDDAAAGVAAATNTLELYASYSFGDYEQ